MFSTFRKRAGHQDIPKVNENLVDIGGELNVPTLLSGYRAGAFPWTVNPVTWWSPDPRALFEFDSFHTPKSLLKFLRKEPFRVTLDCAFEDVIRACATAAPTRRTTWITPEFIEAYIEMHRAGHAHSLEVWEDGNLVGGIYGVGIGGYFAGESMFHRVDNASKAALHFLAKHLQARGYTLFDIQMPTRITVQMGATLVPRREFMQRLREAQVLPVTFGTVLEQSCKFPAPEEDAH